MELMAALEGLSEAPEGSDVELVTDSSYLANAISKGWLDGWQRKGWRTASKQPVANRDLWERMLVELARHGRVRPVLVRGHAGHEANERADKLAQEAAQDAQPRPGGPGDSRPGAARPRRLRPPAHAGRRPGRDRRLRRRPPGRGGLAGAQWWRRGGTLATLRERPLRLTDGGEEREVRLRAVGRPGRGRPGGPRPGVREELRHRGRGAGARPRPDARARWCSRSRTG